MTLFIMTKKRYTFEKRCDISNGDNIMNFDILDKDIFKFDIDFDDF